MIGALLLAVAAPAPQTAIEAERAFAADAQSKGQWTAFRQWAAPDALMFTPRPVRAHDFLKNLKDPPTAVFWWPGASFVSCDGNTAVNSGPWVREWGKSVGYFTTVWKRRPKTGWQWVYDAGDALSVPRAQGGDIAPVTASCTSPPRPMFAQHAPPSASGIEIGNGRSDDQTLLWSWRVTADGARRFWAYQWDGRTMVKVIDDQVAAPPR